MNRSASDARRRARTPGQEITMNTDTKTTAPAPETTETATTTTTDELLIAASLAGLPSVAPTVVRITAHAGLHSGQFRAPPIHVRENEWTSVDLADPEVRAVLLQYVPNYIWLLQGPQTDAALAACGLAFKERNGALVETKSD
jgi:hypothetical protein